MLIATTGWLFAADVRSEIAHPDQHLEWARTDMFDLASGLYPLRAREQ